MSLKQTKTKIRGVHKTHKVTKAMEAVSAVKMRKSQSRAISGRPFAVAAINILTRVGSSLEAQTHSLVISRPIERVTLLVITSDRGLAGSLNSAVIKKAYEAIRKFDLPLERFTLLCLGRKGYEHFRKRGYNVLFHEVNISDDVRHADLEHISRMLAELYASK